MESWAYATTPTPVLAFLPSLLARKTNRPLVAAGDKGVAFAASARSLYVAITRARLHTQVVATESGRTAMDDAALKDGGKTMASELAKEAKAEAASEKRLQGIEISGATSPNRKEQAKTLEPQQEKKAELQLSI